VISAILRSATKVYQPLSYLVPRYWIPFLYNVENGGWLMQALLQQRSAGRNSYSLAGSIDTITKKPSTVQLSK